ncbi:histidine utilization repressor [Luteimonas sp. BDR2-5]|uniref:histidine utilization repressor n=1 Tax=Proluteimonas luteida TaxID=2878685 RepID=UPI001E4AF68E|nr:histidine utilization repressor [Luteimonas sp. BDR2-5]MCD9028257.1 histidine utilization repressor [Luteimonas sp. BDR2-5]
MDSNDPTPLNQRIRADIEHRIRSGEWPPGHRVPPERELMDLYGCSRMTVNRALTMLSENRLIVRRRKAGSFVRAPDPQIESVALQIPDIPLEVAQRGHAYRFELLSRRRRAARRRLAHEMELAGSDGRVLELRGVHLADGQPFALETRLLNPDTVPEAMTLDFSASAPGSWLLHSIPWTRARHRIGAVAADADQAGHLQVATGTACLALERQTWRGSECVTHVRQLFLGGRYELVASESPITEAGQDGV